MLNITSDAEVVQALFVRYTVQQAIEWVRACFQTRCILERAIARRERS